MINRFEADFLGMCHGVANSGELRKTRAGETRQVFGAGIRVMTLRDGFFPVLTSRKMNVRGVFGELAAFLRGCEMLDDFKQHGCNYWDVNAAAWPPNKDRLQSEMRVGKIYGAQWRSFGTEGTDQLVQLVDGLKRDPISRRHLLTSYNPNDLFDMCLPPCHLLAQFQVSDKRLDCLVYMRSVDMCLGLPSDIVLYSTLMILLAKEVGLGVGELQFTFGDCHVYRNHMFTLDHHITTRRIHPLPTWALDVTSTIWNFEPHHLELLNYQHDEPLQYAFNN